MNPTQDEIQAIIDALRAKAGTDELESASTDGYWAAIAALELASGIAPTAEWVPEWFASTAVEAVEQYREAKKAEFDEWQEEFDRVNNAWGEYQRKLGGYQYATPSVSVTPDVLAHSGRCIVYDVGDEGQTYVSNVLTNPTWGDICDEFEQAIEITKDYHHCYLEGLRALTVSEWPEWVYNITSDGKHDDLVVYKFSTGS